MVGDGVRNLYWGSFINFFFVCMKCKIVMNITLYIYIYINQSIFKKYTKKILIVQRLLNKRQTII